MTTTTIRVAFDEAGVLRAITIGERSYTPDELAQLVEAQAEADALRAGRRGLLNRIEELHQEAEHDRASFEATLALLHGKLAEDARKTAIAAYGVRILTLLTRARRWKTAIETMNGIADAETALLAAVADLEKGHDRDRP